MFKGYFEMIEILSPKALNIQFYPRAKLIAQCYIQIFSSENFMKI